MLFWHAVLWSCQTYDQNVSFYSISTTWYGHLSEQMLWVQQRTPVPGTFSFTPEHLWDIHQTATLPWFPLKKKASGSYAALGWTPHRRKAAGGALPEPCQQEPSMPLHSSTGHGHRPHHSKAAALLGRLKHAHGCMKELQAARPDQPAPAGSPRGKDEIIIHWNECYLSGFAPARQCGRPAYPGESSSRSPDRARQWRSQLPSGIRLIFSAVSSARVGDSSSQIFSYSQP